MESDDVRFRVCLIKTEHFPPESERLLSDNRSYEYSLKSASDLCVATEAGYIQALVPLTHPSAASGRGSTPPLIL
ncbi:hypothetical protein SKAU_G00373720 [Synaphobranchus kaupii]|uniref:Uncharacterized protein n=1 Tax=Synaphobranchus kaupii TaxID=118154 RepID=A0A9Q1EGJ3_SYNKA|nr:hypothetical protein SKAU_G00373720 [Synaphobranchus kaupii]